MGERVDRERIGQQVQEFCEGLWQQGDFWEFASSPYERDRCAYLVQRLEGRRYGRVLEIGCGAGYFTHLLAPMADSILALDVAPTAIARAQAARLPTVDFRVANVMDYTWKAEGPWDLIVFNDTICYLGWLYPLFDIFWLASQLWTATTPGGRLLMANTLDEAGYDKLLHPSLAYTYRDLFCHVGYQIEQESMFHGVKNTVPFKILTSLFIK